MWTAKKVTKHSPGTPTTGLRERGNDTSKSTGRSGRQNAATRRNMRREERVTVQGPVKKQQRDGMSHRGGFRTPLTPPPLAKGREGPPASGRVSGGPGPGSNAGQPEAHCMVMLPAGRCCDVPGWTRGGGCDSAGPRTLTPPPRFTSPCQDTYPADAHPSAHKSVLESANPRMDSEGASGCPWSTARATAPSLRQPTPGVVKQDKSFGGSVDTTKTRSGPQRVRMSSGERPLPRAKERRTRRSAHK